MGVVIAGVDPGLTSTGIVIGEFSDDLTLEQYTLDFVKTQPEPTKKLRKSIDNVNRLREVYGVIVDLFWEQEPRVQAVGYEYYQPDSRSGGSGWKTATVATMVEVVCWERGIQPHGCIPSDVKKFACGRVQASKEEVQAAMEERVASFGPRLAKLAKGKREHVADAFAIMLRTAAVIADLRKQMGVV